MRKKSFGSYVQTDWATLLGLTIGSCSIVFGLLSEGGHFSDLAKGSSLAIVFGGTFGAVLVTTPTHVLLSALRSLPCIFRESPFLADSVIPNFLVLAAKARTTGLVSIDADVQAISDPYLRKALSFAVDGIAPAFYRATLEAEILLFQQRGEAVASVFEDAGNFAPTMGIVGSVLGLMQVMRNLDNSAIVGPSICIALAATAYGIIFANLFCVPAAKKLRARLADDVRMKWLALDCTETLTHDVNVLHIAERLNAYRCPDREASSSTGEIAFSTRLTPIGDHLESQR